MDPAAAFAIGGASVLGLALLLRRRGAREPAPPPREGRRLRVRTGPLSGTGFEVGAAGLRIGRNPESCDIVLTEATVSREHALVEDGDGVLTLIHLSWTNPTWVNEHPVLRAELHPGDEVRIGGTVFTVEDPGAG